MADPCIISKEQLSQKELMLKSKLYGAPLASAQPRQTSQSSFQQNASLPPWKQPQLYQEKTLNASPQKVLEHHKTQLNAVTDQKMDTFIDEMRQQFLQTSQASVIPQSLLYQQTRNLERQLQLQEQNAKNMTEIISNVFNQSNTGMNTQAALKQQVFNENRTMMLQMLAPLNQQLNEMKLMYENTKSVSGDVGSKIDELKKVLAFQGDSYMRGTAPMGHSMQVNSMPENIMDPYIVKKGIDDIKEQMRDAQREAHIIESDLERRLQQMTLRNQQQRYLPQSITEEFSQFKQNLTMQNITDGLPSKAQTREAVMNRLGGPFDYNEFLEDLRYAMSEKDVLIQEFKSQQLQPPEFKDKIFGKIDYDFSCSVFSKEPFSIHDKQEEKISYKKPEFLAGIVTEPKYFLDYEKFQQEQQQEIQKQKTLHQQQAISSKPQQPSYMQPTKTQSSGRQQISQKPVSDTYKKKNHVQSEDTDRSFESSRIKKSTPTSSAKKKTSQKKVTDIKNMDLLSLKKQVIEEIKQEMAGGRDLSSLVQDQNKVMQQQFKGTKELGEVNLNGGKDPVQAENDKLQEIMSKMRETQIYSEMNQNVMRQSIQSNNPLSESMLVNAVAEALVDQLQQNLVVPSSSQQPPLDQSMRRYGEEIFVDRIHDILDEIQKEKDAYERRQKSHQRNTSVQVLEQSLEHLPTIKQNPVEVIEQLPVQPQPQPIQPVQQQPVIVPIVINQNNQQQNGNPQVNEIFKNPNQLRDMLSQVISSQLTMHNIRKDKEQEMRESVISNGELNATSRTVEEEEAKVKAEQQELRRQMFINVQPYINQTINMGAYQNPFSFAQGTINFPKTNTYNIQQPLMNELDQFNLSSNSSNFLSFDSEAEKSGRSEHFFKPMEKSAMNKQGDRYSTISMRSEGEIGMDESEGDVSIGEIRYPGSTLKQSQQRVQSINQRTQQQKQGTVNRTPQVQNKVPQGRSNRSQLAETINYEEDKVSPEKDEEKPIYESSEGPIPKQRGKWGQPGGAPSRLPATGKSGANILMSGESFGMNPLRSGALKPGMGGVGPNDSKGFERQRISDNFLEEDEDEDLGSIRASAESGEINPRFLK